MISTPDRHPAGRSRSAQGRAAVRTAFLLAVTVSCSDSPTGPVDPLFARYVAIGNSITAGFQSGGINDSTQQASYPALIARQARAPFAYPSLGVGCPVPIASLERLFTGAIDATCRASGFPGRRVINNVAVPGADSFDPTALTPDSDQLTALMLDGKNQVDKALERAPSLVTVWIGNNDVLETAIQGRLTATRPTAKAVFIANYARMVNRLVAAGVDKGILIGVADVTQIPLLVAPSVFQTPTFQFALASAIGQPVSVRATCTESPGSRISLAIIPALVARTHAPSIDCVPGADFVLDPAEQATIRAAVTEYNTYISAKADSVGFAYLDPNPIWAAARARGEIPVSPDPNNPTQAFGTLFSLDGVHPSSAGHVLIANALIDLIAREFGVQLRRVGG